MTQAQALSILKTGANVFLTGEPGSGKTHLINLYVAYLRGIGIEPSITASTGIAATHIGGMTIHSWSGIGIKTELSKHDLHKIASSGYIAKRVKAAKILIIDEVSMLPPKALSMVDAVCSQIRQNQNLFGGLQVVLVGDFFQLPPIIKSEDDEIGQTSFIKEPIGKFVYDSPVWLRLNPIVCYLTEQYRQDDKNYLNMLSAIRRNTFNSDHLRYIGERKINSSAGPQNVPKLFSHNINVDRVNNEMLMKLSGKPREFNMSSQGQKAFLISLKKSCLSPETLHLKIGASVMFTKNNSKGGFVNGTLGIVEEFNSYTGEPIVKTRDGKRIEVRPMDWMIEENGKIHARVTQLPLRLAWAITVHKSQGMTLDEAVMDLSNVFEFGQGYVALSRIRRFSGLHLLGWNEQAFKVDPEVFDRDKKFRKDSDDTEEEFSKFSPSELQEMQNNFIIGCLPAGASVKVNLQTPSSAKMDSGKNISPKLSFEEIRKKYQNAYKPWGKTEDNKLQDLFTKGLNVAELAKIFSRKNGSIRSRLVKLGLLDK